MIRRGLLAVVLVVLGWAAPAGAHHLPVSAAWKLAQSLPIAAATWPATCQPVTVRTDPDAVRTLDAVDAAGYFTNPQSCVVMVRPTLDPVSFCSALVHEYGHAAGVGHSDDPLSVMFPGQQSWAGCERLRQPRHFVAWVRETLARWTGHRWACRGDAPRRRCVGAPSGRARLVGVVTFERLADGAFTYERSYRGRRR